ncbi:MAG: hypothetical protein IT337_05895 [Thermomicrobiales bacterium]|nr:hypothetical protein [Thermomicrobiales bacterium]
MVSFAWMVTDFDRTHDQNDPRPAAEQRSLPDEFPAARSSGETAGTVRRPPETLPVTVRTMGWRDVPRLRHLDALHVLNQPDASVLGHDPFRSALGAVAPRARKRRPAFVAYVNGRLIGFAQFQSLALDGRWVLLALGSAVGVYDVEPVWEALLTFAVRSAGFHGVKRIYARTPWSMSAGTLFRALDWRPYATETVFFADDLVQVGRGALRPRLQTLADTWAVHQLYSAIVPRDVQDAEALTSRRWETGPERGRGRGPIAGWVFEDDHQLVGAVRSLTVGSTHAIEVLIHPERRELTGVILDGALASLAPHGARRVYCAVRGYQGELAGPLQERGFLAAYEQELFVRYTTATVRRPAVESVPFTLDVREKVPRRAPTFSLAPDDRTAP